MVTGDTNADGFDDLAFETYSDEEENYTSNVVTVLGSKTGLSSKGRQQWSEQQLKLQTNRLGLTLAMGRLDSGATADLVVGASGTKVGSAPDAGAVTVLFGRPGGPSLAGRLTLSEATAGVPGSAEKQDLFGATVGTAFVQGRSQASLIVGAANEKVGTKKAAGRTYTFPRGKVGPSAKGSRAISLDSAGVKGRGRTDARFGLALGGPNSLPEPWNE